jgi:hypothetical protein
MNIIHMDLRADRGLEPGFEKSGVSEGKWVANDKQKSRPRGERLGPPEGPEIYGLMSCERVEGGGTVAGKVSG